MSFNGKIKKPSLSLLVFSLLVPFSSFLIIFANATPEDDFDECAGEHANDPFCPGAGSGGGSEVDEETEEEEREREEEEEQDFDECAGEHANDPFCPDAEEEEEESSEDDSTSETSASTTTDTTENAFEVTMTISGVGEDKGDVVALVTALNGDVSKVKFFEADGPNVVSDQEGNKIEYVASFPNVVVEPGGKFNACALMLRGLELICTEGQKSSTNRPEFVEISLESSSTGLPQQESTIQTEGVQLTDGFNINMQILNATTTEDLVAIVSVNDGEASRLKFLDTEGAGISSEYPSIFFRTSFPPNIVSSFKKYEACVLPLRNLELLCTQNKIINSWVPEEVIISLAQGQELGSIPDTEPSFSILTGYQQPKPQQQPSTPSPSPPPSPTPQEPPSSTTPTTTSPSLSEPNTLTILEGGSEVDPPSLTVTKGETIEIVNEGGSLDTITSGSDGNPDGKFDTGMITSGQTSSIDTSNLEPGEYPYFSTLHPTLQGTIIVEEATATPTPIAAPTTDPTTTETTTSSRSTPDGGSEPTQGGSTTTSTTEPSPSPIPSTPTPQEPLSSTTPTTDAIAQTPNQTQTNDMITYENSTLGFRVQHPSNSSITERGDIVAFSLPEPSSYLLVRVSNLTTPDMSLENYSSITINALSKSRSGFDIEQQENSTTLAGDGNPAFKIVYTDNQTNGDERKSLQTWSLIDDKSYDLTYVTDRTNFNATLPVAMQMIDSFQILGDVKTLYSRGVALAKSGQHEEAIKYYDKVLAIDPNHVNALYGKGAELFNSGRYEEAILSFNKTLAIDPNYILALYYEGVSLANLIQYEEAIKYYDRVLAIDPNHVNALNKKGISLGNLEQHAEAMKYFDKVLDIDPNNVDGLYNMGVAHDSLGQHEVAIKYYDKVLAIDPLNNTGLAR